MAKGKKKADTNDSDNGGFPKKYTKVLSQEWMDEATAYSTDDIKKNIIQFEQVINASESDMNNDNEIKALEERIKELKEDLSEKRGIYSDSISIAYAKIRWSIQVLESRGIVLDRG